MIHVALGRDTDATGTPTYDANQRRTATTTTKMTTGFIIIAFHRVWSVVWFVGKTVSLVIRQGILRITHCQRDMPEWLQHACLTVASCLMGAVLRWQPA